MPGVPELGRSISNIGRPVLFSNGGDVKDANALQEAAAFLKSNDAAVKKACDAGRLGVATKLMAARHRFLVAAGLVPRLPLTG